MKRITVFCGSSMGSEPIFKEQAYQLGKSLAEQNIGLVYGGSSTGLMGTVANGAIENNGNVIGVLPIFLKNLELAHPNLSELILVETMHERKTKMNDLSYGTIMLPGGFGTLEEFFEMLTWGQLGLHKKPVAVLNVNGFYDDLFELIDKMVDKRFLSEVNQKMVIVSDNIDDLLTKMRNYQPPTEAKWIGKN